MFQHVTQSLQTIPTSDLLLASSSSAAASASAAGISLPVFSDIGVSLFEQYKNLLATSPLTTKMVTGGLTAILGDAIGQAANNKDSSSPQPYDTRRAISFVLFDMAYRALQHWAFPAITEACRGQYAVALLSTVGLSSIADNNVGILAAIEQTMANQLGIVPFLYYPVFFSLTTIVQGASMKEGFERASSIFIPLMKRNLLFWVPIQFVQFRFIEESLQVPFVIVAGLIWTIILSVVAGSAKAPEQPVVVMAEEEEELKVEMAMAMESIIMESETAVRSKMELEGSEQSRVQ